MGSGTTSQRARLLVLGILLIASAHAVAQAGQLDPDFGQGGIVTTDFGILPNGTASAAAVTIQPDGKIIVFGGVTSSSGTSVAAVRYNTNGSLDTGFGTAGVATVAGLTFPSALALQPDGKIVGVAFNIGGYGGAFGINIVRFSSTGVLDPAFGTGGVVGTGIFSAQVPSGVVIQPNGDILIAEGELLRLLPDGQFDTSFGTGGQAHVLGGDQANGLALLSNGKILVTSATSFSAGGLVTRYNSNGNLDSSFAIGGQLGATGPSNALLLLSNGEFLVGGDLASSVNGPVGFAVSRYQAVGATDPKFGAHGGVVTPLAGFPTIATSGLGVQANGDIVALGTASASKTSQAFALARYTPTGQLDTTFGTSGSVTTAFGTTTVAASGLAIQADSNIVAVGGYSTTKPNGTDVGFKLARYLGQ
ncbi:MAG: hypothetical protein WBV31_08460 [Terriglobales bacterium]